MMTYTTLSGRDVVQIDHQRRNIIRKAKLGTDEFLMSTHTPVNMILTYPDYSQSVLVS